MKKIFLIIPCILILVGCQNGKIRDNNKSTEFEINAKYEEMKNKLIEYGKLVYKNEQWLNDNSNIVTSYMSLNDLRERNGYDISMFVNPETLEECDLYKTKIEFKISDVSDLNNIKYEFNPILVCGNYSNELEYVKDDNYSKLYDKLFDYMKDIYNVDNIEDKPLDVGSYKMTLGDFQKMGYDISIFKNSKTGNQCNLDETYVLLEVLDKQNGDGYKYLFSYYVNCEE